MRDVRITTFLAFVLFSVYQLSATQATTASATNYLPSIADVAALSFTPLAQAPDLPYTDVSDARGIFLAYDAGFRALAKYRDPILTRGSSGISVFKAVAPAVVVVLVGSVKNNEFDPEGLGTGAIVDPRGYVLTNWHVIERHTEAVVFLKPVGSADIDNAKACIARVIYDDPTVDLALLKLIDPPSTLPTIAIGNIGAVQVAEDIHVIGHPHGNLWSYSTGVISQIRNDYKWSYEDGSKHEAKVLQLQTAINPGNSGGPVVDDTGTLLGLVAMIEEGQNIDYAIAADVITRFMFTGMHMTTRGARKSTSGSQGQPKQLFQAKMADSTSVAKAVYPDMVLYSIGGKNSGLLATFSDGTEVRAWGPDSAGNFMYWSAILPHGKIFTATASAGSVTHISAQQ